MGRELDISHISEEECEQILNVLQKDFTLRQLEKQRLSKIDEEISIEGKRCLILSQQPEFNDTCCMRCFSRFIFLFNQKRTCFSCNYNVCRHCYEWDDDKKIHICLRCLKHRESELQSGDWFYSDVKKRFKRFGSAKVVRSLFKTKFDTDTDSGYDPSLYSANSLPLGRKKRPRILEFFENQQKTHRENPMQANEVNRRLSLDDDVRLPINLHDEDQISKNNDLGKRQHHGGTGVEVSSYATGIHCRSDAYTPPSMFDIEEAGTITKCDYAELDIMNQTLANSMNNMFEQLQQTFSAKQTKAKYEEMIDSYRTELVTELAGFHHSKQLEQSSDATVDRLTRLLVEHVTGVSIVDSNDVATTHSQMADCILDKVVTDLRQWKKNIDNKEEQDVREQLTKLSNQCTISQLSELLTDTETDELSSLHSPRIAESDISDGESSDFHFLDNGGPQSACLQREQFHNVNPLNDQTSNSYTDNHDQVNIWYRQPEHDTESFLSEEHRVHLPSSDDALKSQTHSYICDVETEHIDYRARKKLRRKKQDIIGKKSKLSQQIDNITSESQADCSRWHQSPSRPKHLGTKTDNSNTHNLNMCSQSKELENILCTKSILMIESQNDIKNDSDGTSDTESIIVSTNQLTSTQFSHTSVFDEEANHECLLDFTMSHKIPLPSFDEQDFVSIPGGEVDFDDISRTYDVSSDDSCAGVNTTIDTEVLFGDSWDLNLLGRKQLFSDDSSISAYDNMGSRRLGSESNDTLKMYIPLADCETSSAPRIGNINIEDVPSDLSEVDELRTDPNNNENNVKVKAEPTQDVPAFIIEEQEPKSDNSRIEYVKQVVDAIVERQHDRVNMLSADLEINMTFGTIETDPLFIHRPVNITTAMGEVTKFRCELEGTAPLDIFWFRDLAEVEELRDGEHYAITTTTTNLEHCEITDAAPGIKSWIKGRSVLEIYNTAASDAGQYLCIGVNDVGECHQAIKLNLIANNNLASPPEFLRLLDDKETSPGNTVKFHCKIKGYPQPRVIFRKDGKHITQCLALLKYNIEKIGNRDYVLTINDVDADDDAEYSVHASNIEGHVSCSAQLIVLTDEDCNQDDFHSTQTLHCHDSSISQSPDTDALLLVAKQASDNRLQMKGTTDDMEISAQQLSFMNNELDRMDLKLDDIEDEVKGTTTDNPLIHNPTSNSLRAAIIRQHNDVNAAMAMRKVTGTALQVITNTETIISEGRSAMEHTRSTSSSDEDAPLYMCDDKKPSQDSLSIREFENKDNNDKISRHEVRSGNFDHTVQMSGNLMPTDRVVLGRDQENKADVDVDMSQYSRDFEVAKPKANPEKADDMITQRINSTEDDVYIAASCMSGLQERIRELEQQVNMVDNLAESTLLDNLEDEVAKLSAKVVQSEKQTTNIELSVNILERQFSQHDSGTTMREPGTNPDVNEDSQSVQHLTSKFQQLDDQSEGASFKRVGSLTGRTIPRNMRERLKQQQPLVSTINNNIRVKIDSTLVDKMPSHESDSMEIEQEDCL